MNIICNTVVLLLPFHKNNKDTDSFETQLSLKYAHEAFVSGICILKQNQKQLKHKVIKTVCKATKTKFADSQNSGTYFFFP